jgi:formylmethanofuran dehydrogenase subunit C
MPLVLRRNTRPCQRIRLFGIVPNVLGPLSLDEICQLDIEVNDQAAKLGDWFSVQDGDRNEIVLQGDVSACDSIGGMINGRLKVESSVGDMLAERMSGGEIEVDGSTGRFACGKLKGGVVQVQGDCGPYAASAPTGQSRGMSGGVLVIHGNCDQWLATRMRRGLVVVYGNVAAGCASRMIAGTVVLCKHAIQPLGAHMVRGTILMLGPETTYLAPPGFTTPENTELSYLPILMSEVDRYLPAALKATKTPATVWRSLGDRLNQGLGEIIWSGQAHVAENHLVAHS